MAFSPEELELAQPQAPADGSVEAWYMDDLDADQRLPHKWATRKEVALLFYMGQHRSQIWPPMQLVYMLQLVLA